MKIQGTVFFFRSVPWQQLLIVFLEMVKEDDGVKHDEQAKFIDSKSVFARKIPDYQLSIWY